MRTTRRTSKVSKIHASAIISGAFALTAACITRKQLTWDASNEANVPSPEPKNMNFATDFRKVDDLGRNEPIFLVGKVESRDADYFKRRSGAADEASMFTQSNPKVYDGFVASARLKSILDIEDSNWVVRGPSPRDVAANAEGLAVAYNSTVTMYPFANPLKASHS